MELLSVMDSIMLRICKHSAPMRRKAWNNYKDPVLGWLNSIMGWFYGRKCPMEIDIYSLMIIEWMVTKENIHDSNVSHDMVDSVRNFSYILPDSA